MSGAKSLQRAETGTTVETIDLAISVLGRLHDGGLDKAMMSSARNCIMGQFPPGLKTGMAIAETPMSFARLLRNTAR